METDPIARRLRRIVELGWLVPYPESRLLVSLLLTSDVPAAIVLRTQLEDFDIHYWTKDGIDTQEVSTLQMHEVFQTTLTPRLIMGLIETFVEQGTLSRGNAVVIESHILARVDHAGAWKTTP